MVSFFELGVVSLQSPSSLPFGTAPCTWCRLFACPLSLVLQCMSTLASLVSVALLTVCCLPAMQFTTYNPCSIIATSRLEEISQELASQTVCALIGTRCKSLTAHGHSKQRLGAHVAIHAGWKVQGQYSNRSCGLCVLLQHKAKPKVLQIKLPGDDLKGRGMSITVLLKGTKFKLVLAYFLYHRHSMPLKQKAHLVEQNLLYHPNLSTSLYPVPPPWYSTFP